MDVNDLSSATSLYVEDSVRKALALKSLAKAVEFLALGIAEDPDECISRKAKQKFQSARGWIVNYKEILKDLGLNGIDLDSLADLILEKLDNLIAWNCSAVNPP